MEVLDTLSLRSQGVRCRPIQFMYSLFVPPLCARARATLALAFVAIRLEYQKLGRSTRI